MLGTSVRTGLGHSQCTGNACVQRVSPCLAVPCRTARQGPPRRGRVSRAQPEVATWAGESPSTSSGGSRAHSSGGRVGVAVQLEKPSFSSRKLMASIPVAAPMDIVWAALTDYEGLGNFIPSLAENRCLERRPNGARLYQVGAQDVAMGVKFTARCTLECIEHLEGIPQALCTKSCDRLDDLFPWPSNSLPGRAARDISFELVEGDFKTFKGVWRMQPGMDGEHSTLLVYVLYVQPQKWLPVGLIQNRISREVVNNLEAVRAHSERLHSSGSSSGDSAL